MLIDIVFCETHTGLNTQYVIIRSNKIIEKIIFYYEIDQYQLQAAYKANVSSCKGNIYAIFKQAPSIFSVIKHYKWRRITVQLCNSCDQQLQLGFCGPCGCSVSRVPLALLSRSGFESRLSDILSQIMSTRRSKTA